jgi:hypothetical protein
MKENYFVVKNTEFLSYKCSNSFWDLFISAKKMGMLHGSIDLYHLKVVKHYLKDL